MTDLQQMARGLRRRGYAVSLQRARGLASEHGLTAARAGRHWVLYRADGFGHLVSYDSLVELVLALVPPE